MNATLTKRIIGGTAAVAVLLLGLILLAPKPPQQSTKLKVVAAQNFWGNIAAQIGGSRVEVTSIISDPEADPHLYETGAKDASALTNADVVILNGRGYDDFAQKALASAPNQGRITVIAADVIDFGSDANPHFWYDLPRTGLIATAIQEALSKKDPAGDEIYKANLIRFLDTMEPLLQKLDDIRSSYAGTPVAFTERVSEYLIVRAGLNIKSPASFAAAIEQGDEPSPGDQAAMLSLIEQKQIRVLFYNPQADSPVTEKIKDAATAKNIPVVAVTETLPPSFTTYQDWQLAQLEALQQALEKTD